MINMIILLLFLSVSTVLSIQGYYKLAISKPDTVSLSDTNIVAFYGTHVYVRPFSSTSFRKVNNSLQIQTTNLTNIQTDSNSLFLWNDEELINIQYDHNFQITANHSNNFANITSLIPTIYQSIIVQTSNTLFHYQIPQNSITYFQELKSCSNSSVIYKNLNDNSTNTSIIAYLNHSNNHQLIRNLDSHIDFCSLNASIWLAADTPKYQIIVWTNFTIQFKADQTFEFNFIYPHKKLFFLNNSDVLQLTYLFSLNKSIVFVLHTSNTVCYQYFKHSQNITYYNNILCMQLKHEKQKIAAIGYRKQDQGKLQLIIETNDTVYADEFNACILYRPIGLYACQLCYQGRCPSSCHSLRQNDCLASYYFVRTNMMGAMLILMMGFLIGSLIIQLIKSLKDIITLVAKAFAFLIEIFFCQIPKLIKKGFLLLKMKYRSMRLRYQHSQLPSQQCPICLDQIQDPVFFSCERHSACQPCMSEYILRYSQQTCPFRD